MPTPPLHPPAVSPLLSVTPEIGTLGARLERQRLERRRERLLRAVAALHGRAGDHGGDWGTVPRALRAALRDFEAELEAVGRRLNALS